MPTTNNKSQKAVNKRYNLMAVGENKNVVCSCTPVVPTEKVSGYNKFITGSKGFSNVVCVVPQ